jgi:hypothetical protein
MRLVGARLREGEDGEAATVVAAREAFGRFRLDSGAKVNGSSDKVEA